MFRKTAVIATLLALLVPSAALAQQNNQDQQNQGTPTQPFQPLPPAQPTPAPTAEPDDGDGFLNTEISGSATLYIIAAALLGAFIFIGMFISRDANVQPSQRRFRWCTAISAW